MKKKTSEILSVLNTVVMWFLLLSAVAVGAIQLNSLIQQEQCLQKAKRIDPSKSFVRHSFSEGCEIYHNHSWMKIP